MKVIINRTKPDPFGSAAQWIIGTVGPYKFQLKRFPEPSRFGIDEGRISKLFVGEPRNYLLAYDRGWEVRSSQIEDDILPFLLAAFD